MLATLSFFVLVGSAGAATTPEITGDATVGQTLQLNETPGAISEVWWECPSGDLILCAPTSDTSDAYPLTTTDVGDTLFVLETESDGTFQPSNSVGPVAAAAPSPPLTPAPVNTVPPSIPAGTTQPGQTLTTGVGQWENDPTSYGYQWMRCATQCVAIPGATASTYQLADADVGDTIAVAVTATNAGGSATATSGQTSTVTAPAPTPHTSGLGAPASTTAPSITGAAQLGQTLTAKLGSWTNNPTSYDYQWERCAAQCADIPGATTATYQLALPDVGDAITLKVTAANATGSATAASSRTSEVTAPSTIQIVASPSSPLVNQPVTLVGIVSSGAQGTDPSGTVAFQDAGQPVPGCAGVTVPASGQTVTVSCVTSFPVSSPTLTAAFSPVASSPLLGSSSAATGISVLRGYSTTSLDVSGETERGASTTYTVSIAAAMDLVGPVLPTGTVTFLDHGKAISSCRAAPIKDAGATCTVRYPQTGAHAITARYNGDADFRGSVSQAKTVRVTAPPSKSSKLLGRITATMQWTFHYTPSYTRIIELVLYGAHAGSTVTINCSGRGCPFKAHTRTVPKPKRCRSTRKHACPASGTIDLESSFRRRDLRAHARVTVTVTRGRYVGKYYRFTIRPRKQPLVDISCLAVGSSKPGVGCTRH